MLYFIFILWWQSRKNKLWISAKTADCKGYTSAEKLNWMAMLTDRSSAGIIDTLVDTDPCRLVKSEVGFLHSTEVLLFNVTLHLAFHISPSWISCSNSTYLSPFVSGSNTGSWLSGFLCVEGTVSLRCPLARNKSMYVYFEREILILPLLIDSTVIHRGNSVRVSCEFKGIINQVLWEDLWFSPLLLFPLPFLYYAGLWYMIRVYTCLAQTMPSKISVIFIYWN